MSASHQGKFARRRSILLTLVSCAIFAIAAPAPGRTAISPSTPSGSLNAEAPVSNAAVRKLLKDAETALKSGNINLTLILLKNAVNAEPRNGVIRANLALVMLRTGDTPSAERELRQARADGAPDQIVLPALFQAMLTRREYQKLLDEFPDPGPTGQGLGASIVMRARAEALQALGHASDASAAMDRALALHRDVPSLLAGARLALNQGNKALAQSLLNEAVKSAPTDEMVLTFQLGMMMQDGDFPGALALTEKILKQNPNALAVRAARIELLLKQKQDGRARAEVDTILAGSPSSPVGLYYKALLFARANDVKAAWGIVQGLPPEFVQSQPTIAMTVAEMAALNGRDETAASILSSALVKSPDSVEVRVRLAALRLKEKSAESALVALQPLQTSTDPRVQALLAEAYKSLGRYNDALDALNRITGPANSATGVARERVFVEMKAGQSSQALRDLTELASKTPTDPTVVAPLIAMLVQAKRFPDSLAAADRLGDDPKKRTIALSFRGQILRFKGDEDGALIAYQKVLALDPKNTTALFFRADLYAARHQLAPAETDLKTLLTVDPKNVSALLKLAEIAALRNQDVAVREYLSKAIAAAPSNPSPQLTLVRYLAAKRDLKGALAVAQRATGKFPKNSDAVELLGAVQFALGQKEQAISTFKRLSSLQPRAAKPLLLLANVYFAKGDKASATAALTTADQFEPNSGDVRAAQLNLKLIDGDSAGALNLAKAYRTANPGPASDILLADTLTRIKQPDQAATILNNSFAASPNQATLNRLVDLRIQSGAKATALDLLSKWIKSNPNDVTMRLKYADLLMTSGDSAAATKQYDLVAQADPINVQALNNLAWLLQHSDTKRALAMATRARTLSPDSPDVLDTYGIVQIASGDAKGALSTLKRAHDLKTSDGEISYHLALAYDAVGNRNAARELLQTLVKSGAVFTDRAQAQQKLSNWH